MKNLFVFFCFFVGLTGYAQTLPDSVIMKVAGDNIPLAEFIYIGQKNNELDLSDANSVKEYVELFKNFKLKVAEAKALGLNRSKEFERELRSYETQLYASFMSDKPGEEIAVKKIYDRGNEILELSHILFRLPEQTVSKDTVAVYEKAMEIYNRIQQGEDIDAVGSELFENDSEQIGYEYVRALSPMRSLKAFEEAVYALPVGTVSKPIRTSLGFHIAKVHSRRPHPGRLMLAQIAFAFPQKATPEQKEAIAKQAESIYERAKNGEDFAELAKAYSTDTVFGAKGGVQPELLPGDVPLNIEKQLFALNEPGELSPLISANNGYFIYQLIEKRGRKTFDEEKTVLTSQMRQGERNFELLKSYDDRLKKEYGYTFYPENYAELEALCYDIFPISQEFHDKTEGMNKTVFTLDTLSFPQNEFATFMGISQLSTKTYACDFMKENYDLFVREILTTLEKRNFAEKYPEYNHLLQEYRDGILLFEISNDKIWSKPTSEQQALEEQWIAELNKKYPVEINWKILEKLQKQK
ncbi:peptidylprolyl isomerase [Parabacteroides sp. PF5-9]|uniref:foldase protein PrsA n=1 Tax=Parabacteroides sp. PF5-9 TaxID=1742404 RepID=UPI00247482A7|nr:peptidylprolyl isomerase [Parabacteroides sp. PF5-9]